MSRRTFRIFLKTWRTLDFSSGCDRKFFGWCIRKWFLRGHKNILRQNVFLKTSKVKFPLGLWAHSFWLVLSKLHSMCPETYWRDKLSKILQLTQRILGNDRRRKSIFWFNDFLFVMYIMAGNKNMWKNRNTNFSAIWFLTGRLKYRGSSRASCWICKNVVPSTHTQKTLTNLLKNCFHSFSFPILFLIMFTTSFKTLKDCPYKVSRDCEESYRCKKLSRCPSSLTTMYFEPYGRRFFRLLPIFLRISVAFSFKTKLSDFFGIKWLTARRLCFSLFFVARPPWLSEAEWYRITVLANVHSFLFTFLLPLANADAFLRHLFFFQILILIDISECDCSQVCQMNSLVFRFFAHRVEKLQTIRSVEVFETLLTFPCVEYSTQWHFWLIRLIFSVRVGIINSILSLF